MSHYLSSKEPEIRNARLYILRDNLFDVTNGTDNKFDLYVGKNGSRIKGAIEIMPSITFILDTPNRERIRYVINNEFFESVFKCKAPDESKHSVIRMYVREDSPLIERSQENFRGDVYWIKEMNSHKLWKFMMDSLLHFMRNEFDSYSIDIIADADINGVIKTHSNMDWMMEYRLEVTTTPELLTELIKSRPRLFNKKLDFMSQHEPKRYFNSIEV